MTAADTEQEKPNVLITGAGGLVGGKVLEAISCQRKDFGTVTALDVRAIADRARLPEVEYLTGDVCDPELDGILRDRDISAVVHLAAILAPGKDSSVAAEYRVDVLGTENVIKAALAAGVNHLIALSSGAAYGYHASNPVPLQETDDLRGNDEFPYSRHKRLVEEMLERHRNSNPELRQLILRSGTILGANVRSPVSAIFEGPFVLGIAGADSPFVMILVDDVASIIVKGILDAREGIYNLAGDGALTLRDIAKRAGKPLIPIPGTLLEIALWGLKGLRLSVRGPEAVNFLRYRPVLANDHLKTAFGFVPTMTSVEVFDHYLQSMSAGKAER